MSTDFDFDFYLNLDPNNPVFQRDVNYVVEVLHSYRDKEWIPHERYRDIAVRLQLHGQPPNNYIGKAFRLFDSIHYNGFDRLNWDMLSFQGVLEARAYCNRYGLWLNTHHPRLNDPATLNYIFSIARRFKADAESNQESKWSSLKELRMVITTTMIQGVVSKNAIETPIRLLIAGLVMYYEVWENYPRQADPRAEATNSMNLFATAQEESSSSEGLSYGHKYGIEMLKDFLLGDDNVSKVFSRWLESLREVISKQGWTGERAESELRSFRLVTGLPTYKIALRDVIVEFARMSQMGTPYVHIFNKEHLYNALNYANKFTITFTNENLVDELVVRFIDDPMRGIVDKGKYADSITILQRNLNMLREYQIISPQDYEKYLARGRVAFR